MFSVHRFSVSARSEYSDLTNKASGASLEIEANTSYSLSWTAFLAALVFVGSADFGNQAVYVVYGYGATTNRNLVSKIADDSCTTTVTAKTDGYGITITTGAKAAIVKIISFI